MDVKLITDAAAKRRVMRLKKIYCEHGALTPRIKALGRSGSVELVHFPYDPKSHTTKIPDIGVPSAAQIKDLNLPIEDLPGQITDYSGSEHLDEVLSIIGGPNRRDALHVDHAYKSGCSAFVTGDHHILDHKRELEDLLGIRFFDPHTDIGELEQFVVRDCGAD
jgi:hypothetical protein